MTETPQDPIAGLALGRRPPSDKPTLKARDFLRVGVGPIAPTTLPEHPVSVDHFGSWDYPMNKNDQFGVCGPSSLAHLALCVTGTLTGTPRIIDWADIKALYVRQNPHFNETTDAGDGGVDMKTMLADAVKYGYGPQKILGFAEVDASNPEEIKACVAIFGGVLLGLDLKVAQSNQFNAAHPVWDWQSGSPEWGGHAVFEAQYVPDGEGIVTWTRRVQMTPAFVSHARQEAYVVILPEHLGSRQFMDGWDVQKFASAFTVITGRPFPADVPASGGGGDTPVTPPAGDGDADDTLADAVRDWVFNHKHSGIAKVVADALKAWFRATGRA